MRFTYQTEAKPVDGYTIRRGIHRGGFGEVYYAVSDAGKEVALKLLTHDLDTELRGIRQCLNLKHPNLVTIFDVRTDGDGDHWVVMEYMQGSSLDDVLAAFPNGLPLNEVSDWLQGLCAGVEFLHDRGIVHRDLKPANVYRENGVVKIGDVGLSKRMGGNPRSQHTESVGTVYYMAPEVAQGKYGPGVDIYSLGVMAYEMLTGRLPFDGETTAEILMKHLTQPPDLKPLPAAVRPVIARALEKDPHKRTASVRDFAEGLRRVLNGASKSGFSESLASGFAATSPGVEAQLSEKPGFSSIGFAQYPSTPLPESSFLPLAPPLKRDTDCAHDTSRRNGAQPASRPYSSSRAAPAPRPLTPKPRGPWWRGWLPWAGVAAVLFVPWSQMSWNEIGIVSCVAGLWGAGLYAIAWWCTPVDQRGWSGGPAGRSALPAVHGGVSFAEQLSGSLLLGTLLAGVLTLAGLMGLSWLDPHSVRGLPGSAVGLMIGVSAIATAALLAAGQAPVLGHELLRTRAGIAGLGGGVGALAFALSGFLLAEFPDLGDSSHSVFEHVGAHRLWVDHQPTIVSYMVFFAALLGLQNWRKLLNPLREQRLRIGAIAAAGFMGWLVSMFFGVPRPYAVVWAVAITTGAQLAAPWQPRGIARHTDAKTA